MKDTHPTELALVMVDHCVCVAKVEHILVEVDSAMLALHVSLQEDLLEELAVARLDAALEEATVVPGDPTRTVLSPCWGPVHREAREILTMETSLLLEASSLLLLLVEERFC